jgi:hypothetical protein
MDFVVYAVALLLVASVVLFIKAAFFDHRPQKFGFLLSLLALPLYLVYYNDRWPFEPDLRMRDVVRPLEGYTGANPDFASDIAPALIIGLLVLIRMTVFQRVAVRRRLQRVHDPIANFFAGATIATLVGGTLVSTFAWGWVGAVIVGIAFTLVYLGALALLAAFIEVAVEVSKLVAVWLKRKVFAIATRITRFASWVSSLSGRLVSRALIERLRADQAKQESIFLEEQEAQDRRLYEAYLKDRERRRRLARRAGRSAGAEVEDPPFDALVSGEILPTAIPAFSDPMAAAPPLQASAPEQAPAPAAEQARNT